MTEQGNLWNDIKHPEPIKGQTYEEAFKRFNELNPHVLAMMERESLKMKDHVPGLKHIGIDFIFARLRWLYAFTTGGDNFKLNNNFKAFYARELMDTCPSLEGFFHLRNQRSRHKIMKVVKIID